MERSRSVRAAEAEADGSHPISKWRKSVFLEECKRRFDDGLFEQMKKLKNHAPVLLKEGRLVSTEWCHVGPFTPA